MLLKFMNSRVFVIWLYTVQRYNKDIKNKKTYMSEVKSATGSARTVNRAGYIYLCVKCVNNLAIKAHNLEVMNQNLIRGEYFVTCFNLEPLE